MKLAIGSDERTALTDAVIIELESRGHLVTRFGALQENSSPEERRWTSVAQVVGEVVSSGTCENGILFCWTGTGVSIAANKFHGVRAALCVDAETAKGARRWNDANVLVMSLRLTSEAVAKEILREWFITPPDTDSENNACLAALSTMDRAHRNSFEKT